MDDLGLNIPIIKLLLRKLGLADLYRKRVLAQVWYGSKVKIEGYSKLEADIGCLKLSRDQQQPINRIKTFHRGKNLLNRFSTRNFLERNFHENRPESKPRKSARVRFRWRRCSPPAPWSCQSAARFSFGQHLVQ